MSKRSNLSVVVHKLLSNANLTREESSVAFREIGTGDDTVLAEQMLEITQRENEYTHKLEERLAELVQAYEDKLESHRQQYAEKLLAFDHQINTMIASRNVALNKAADGDDLAAVYEKYDSSIYNAKVSRKEVTDNFKILKNVLYRELQENKRRLLAEQREKRLVFEQERINARRAYHNHKNAIVEKWLMIVNERDIMKGGAA